MNYKFEFKNDKYRRARGGSAALLELNCSSCASGVAYYQKDGPGNLVRCYLNRFVYPKWLSDLHRDTDINKPSDLSPLRCPRCSSIIGVPMHYKDGRLAYRLISGTFTKQIISPQVFKRRLSETS